MRPATKRLICGCGFTGLRMWKTVRGYNRSLEGKKYKEIKRRRRYVACLRGITCKVHGWGVFALTTSMIFSSTLLKLHFIRSNTILTRGTHAERNTNPMNWMTERESWEKDRERWCCFVGASNCVYSRWFFSKSPN